MSQKLNDAHDESRFVKTLLLFLFKDEIRVNCSCTKNIDDHYNSAFYWIKKLLRNAGNFLMDTNYILKVYVVYLLGTTTYFWQHDWWHFAIQFNHSTLVSKT